MAAARIPTRHSAFAKWVHFLGDVYVVSSEKIQNAALLFQHFDIIARQALGPAPTLTKAVSRSPAMVVYLDLNQSQKTRPTKISPANSSSSSFSARATTANRTSRKPPAPSPATVCKPPASSSDPSPRNTTPHPKPSSAQTAAFTGDGVIDLAYAPARSRLVFAARDGENST